MPYMQKQEFSPQIWKVIIDKLMELQLLLKFATIVKP